MASSSSAEPQTSVLFVCLGNICRSTLAEAVFRNHLEADTAPKIAKVDSCGTGAYHEGAQPDSRTLAVLKKQGIAGYKHRARKIKSSDFEDFEYIFAMDSSNLEDLQDMRRSIVQKRRSEAGLGKVMLFGAHSGNGSSRQEEIDDPYYGGASGFDVAYEQVNRFSINFIQELQKQSKARV